MMDTQCLVERLITEEGNVLHPYWDEIGKVWTGGVGHNLTAHCPPAELVYILKTKTITPEQSRRWLEEDIQEALLDCKEIFSEFDTFSENRQEALVDVRFNLGLMGFRRFKKMIAAVELQDWERAADELMDSDAGRTLHTRYSRLSDMLRGG